MAEKGSKRSLLKWILIGAVIGLLILLGSAFLGDDGGMLRPLASLVCEFAGSPDNKDHCIKWVATTIDAPSMCDQIEGERFKTTIEGKTVQLENPPKMECITQVAASRNDPALCDRVEGMMFAANKIDCLYRVAQTNKNAAACNLIGDATQSRMGSEMSKEGCLAAMAR